MKIELIQPTFFGLYPVMPLAKLSIHKTPGPHEGMAFIPSLNYHCLTCSGDKLYFFISMAKDPGPLKAYFKMG